MVIDRAGVVFSTGRVDVMLVEADRPRNRPDR